MRRGRWRFGHLYCRPNPRICMQEGLPTFSVLLISSVPKLRHLLGRKRLIMKGLGRRNSAFGPIVETTILMNDRVCWFGDGVFDAGPARKHLIAAAKRLGIGVHDAASMEPRGAASFPLSTVSAWMLNGKSSRRFCAHRCDAVARRALLRSSFSVRLTLGRL